MKRRKKPYINAPIIDWLTLRLAKTVTAPNMPKMAPEAPTEKEEGRSHSETRFPASPPRKYTIKYSGSENISSALNPKTRRKSMLPARCAMLAWKNIYDVSL